MMGALGTRDARGQTDWRQRAETGRATRGVMLAAIAALLVTACSNDDATGPRKVLDVAATAVGRCMNVSDEVGATISTLPEAVACSTPHTHEIYSVFSLDAGEVYPGFEALESVAQRECLEDFEDYVGISAFDSSLFYSWIVPTLDSWQDEKAKDREVLCVAGLFKDGLLEMPIKGAAI